MDGITLQCVSAVPMLHHKEIIIFQRSFLGLFFLSSLSYFISSSTFWTVILVWWLYLCIHLSVSHKDLTYWMPFFFFFPYCELQIISCEKLKNVFQFLWILVRTSVWDQELIQEWINMTWELNRSIASHLSLPIWGKRIHVKVKISGGMSYQWYSFTVLYSWECQF